MYIKKYIYLAACLQEALYSAQVNLKPIPDAMPVHCMTPHYRTHSFTAGDNLKWEETHTGKKKPKKKPEKLERTPHGTQDGGWDFSPWLSEQCYLYTVTHINNCLDHMQQMYCLPVMLTLLSTLTTITH